MRLDPADIEAIAQRTAELLTPQEHSARYVDAAQLARILDVERRWVYAHARRLGGIRLGGAHGRLRFDVKHATRTLATAGGGPSRTPPGRQASRQPARCQARVDLLPYES